MTIVAKREGRLFAQTTNEGEKEEEFELLPESETTFFYREFGLPIIFARDANDKVSHLVLNGAHSAKRIT